VTLLEISDYCAASLGFPDATTKTQAKEFARLRWKMIWDALIWRQSRVRKTMSVTAGTQVVTMDSDVQKVLAVRIDGQRELMPSDDLAQMALDPAGADTSGDAVAFMPEPSDSSGNARIRLHRPPLANCTLLLICKAKCTPLVNDSDSPTLDGVDQCLIAYTLGDLYQWARQGSRAQIKFQ
jgi:hypothetical protein